MDLVIKGDSRMLYKAKAKVAFSIAIMPIPYKTWVDARRRKRLLSVQKGGKFDINWLLHNDLIGW